VQVPRRSVLDLLNQAVAGHVFDATTLEGLGRLRKHPPTTVVVAMAPMTGTARSRPSASAGTAANYLDTLAEAFPKTPVYVLSPLWRADEDEPRPCGRGLAWMGSMLADLCDHRKHMTFVDGHHVIPRNPVMLSDQVLHPGPVAAAMVSADACLCH